MAVMGWYLGSLHIGRVKHSVGICSVIEALAFKMMKTKTSFCLQVTNITSDACSLKDSILIE